MKVLVADDDPVSRRLLSSYLEKWGYAVTQAVHGAQAWSLFQNDYFPLVIVDWMMPEMDGLELVRRIRAAEGPGYVYTILVTARSNKEDLIQGMDAGADDFISKPFDRDELRVRMREGERIIALERSATERNRALRDAQAALAESARLAGGASSATLAGIARHLAAALDELAALRHAVPPGCQTELDHAVEQLRQALALAQPEGEAKPKS